MWPFITAPNRVSDPNPKRSRLTGMWLLVAGVLAISLMPGPGLAAGPTTWAEAQLPMLQSDQHSGSFRLQAPWDCLRCHDQNGATLARISRVCLECHDGSVGQLTNLAGELDNHPAGIEYRPTSQGRAGLREAFMPSGLGGTIEDDLLIDGQVECTSCHSFHDRPADEWEAAKLRIPYEALCTTCHDR